MVYSSDEDLNSNYRDLCLAVGHLFIGFGRLEGVLSSLLRLHLANNFGGHLTKMQGVALSSAIYGSMRLKAARDTLRRLAAVEDVPKSVDGLLDNVFAQVGHIEALRDKIAHQTVVPAASPDEGYWQVSDQTVTRDIKNLKIYLFDVDAVLAAADDLITACDRLGGKPQKRSLFASLDTTPPTWRYKPSMLKHVRLGRARTR